MVKTTTITYSTPDEQTIYARSWENDKEDIKPKAIVQIAHGMAEHVQRYDYFAEKLVEEGFIVFGNDHRGHGKTGEYAKRLGYFADEDGFEKVVDDMYRLTNFIIKMYPNSPIILFGHSMGSFLSRRYVQKYGNEIDGLILSGTGGNPGLLGKLGKFLAKQEMRKRGPKYPSYRMTKLTFGSYNKKFKPNRTDFDWLTRDEQVVDEYLKDPLCGFICSAGFFYDLLGGLAAIHKKANVNQMPKDLPVYFLSGDMDPVGNYGKGVLQVVQSYEKVGLTNASHKLYPNARHEILNEINKDEVIEDILTWIHNNNLK